MPDLYQTITDKVFEAIEADEAGDVDRALQLMQQAQLALSVLPDGKNEDSEMSFDRESISRAVSELKRKRNAKCGVVTQEIRRVRG
ncbi:hypothetical protein [Allorhodopirellula heiligendammensis]|uniref:Uncharacterized protein n=1 Tax=Allorhodopirellula heiligendammensis TaxID=2714739 RepID=A0A5C6BUM4_9BACT|nr:hypothetical protein [Allorhodopirellula heiligendammensis]TWU15970.1 hypothetical protein Poly21_31740 [Allorhodopirellula heiligendammensis]|tara:strand:- start:881 stop:1138 length:258 start_codon:yes stop_codon:yes gene_type:complete